MIGRVVLRGDALDLLPLLEPDDAINATGRVDALEDGPAVIVGDPAGISLAGDPQAPAADRPADPGGPSPDPIGPPAEAGLPAGPSFSAGVVGFAILSAVSAASLAITLTRRWYVRRRLAGRIAVRLAGLGALPAASAAPRSTERGGSTFNSA
jgi:hypothetical protein